jgi:esterase
MGLPEGKDITLNGIRIHYFEWGNPNDPVIICLHSHSAHAGIWDQFGPAMSDKFHVYALDQRGHGDSEWAEDGYDRDRFVEDLDAFITMKNINKCTLVGSSMGGWNSLLYSVNNHEKVERIVLVDIGIESSGVTIQRPPRPLEFDTFEIAFQTIRSENPWPAGDRLRNDLQRKLTQDNENGPLRWKTDPVLITTPLIDMQSPELIERYWNALRSIQFPILEIRGAESVLVSDDVLKKMKEACPSLESVDVSGSGHVVSLDKPEKFNSIFRDWVMK